MQHELSREAEMSFRPVAPVVTQNRRDQIARVLPSALYRHLRFRRVHGTRGNFREPTTFSEKLSWRILYDRRDLLSWTCDKLAMKDYANAVDGLEIEVPEVLWTGTDVRDLAGVELSGDWVLKPNHASGRNIVFGTGPVADTTELATHMVGAMDEEQASILKEWAYTQARRCLLVERRVPGLQDGAPPWDYKFYVFGGRIGLIQVDSGRHTDDHRRSLYSRDWQRMFRATGMYSTPDAERPVLFDRMVQAAELLGAPFDYIRVDLYATETDVYFGEITPYPGSGLEKLEPPEAEYELGALWTLPDADTPGLTRHPSLVKRAEDARARVVFGAARQGDHVRFGDVSRLYANREDNRGAHLLRQNGVTEPKTTYLWKTFVSRLEPSLVLDVGANYGEIFLSTRYAPETEIVIFEPNPNLEPFLRQSIASHVNGAQIRFETSLVSDVRERQEFFVDEKWSGTSSAVGPIHDEANEFKGAGEEKFSALSVPAVRVDDIVGGLDLEARTLLFKIDVEGFEAKAFGGMLETLARVRSFVGLVEFDKAYLTRAGTTPEAFLALLRAHATVMTIRRRRLRHVASAAELPAHTDLIVGSDEQSIRGAASMPLPARLFV